MIQYFSMAQNEKNKTISIFTIGLILTKITEEQVRKSQTFLAVKLKKIHILTGIKTS